MRQLDYAVLDEEEPSSWSLSIVASVLVHALVIGGVIYVAVGKLGETDPSSEAPRPSPTIPEAVAYLAIPSESAGQLGLSNSAVVADAAVQSTARPHIDPGQPTLDVAASSAELVANPASVSSGDRLANVAIANLGPAIDGRHASEHSDRAESSHASAGMQDDGQAAEAVLPLPPPVKPAPPTQVQRTARADAPLPPRKVATVHQSARPRSPQAAPTVVEPQRTAAREVVGLPPVPIDIMRSSPPQMAARANSDDRAASSSPIFAPFRALARAFRDAGTQDQPRRDSLDGGVTGSAAAASASASAAASGASAGSAASAGAAGSSGGGASAAGGSGSGGASGGGSGGSGGGGAGGGGSGGGGAGGGGAGGGGGSGGGGSGGGGGGSGGGGGGGGGSGR
jgi:hypothetical protein